MRKLRAPLKQWLDASLSEAQLQTIWRRVPKEPRRRLRWTLLGASAAFAVSGALFLALMLLRPAAPAPGPLGLAGRAALSPAAQLNGAERTAFALSDGSQIRLEQSALLSVLENNARAFAVHLERGRGTFDVNPGGPRRWLIECGVASVEVVGTSFSIERTEQGVRVSVTRGVVLVRGERVIDRVRRVAAGQTLYVPGLPQAAQPAAVSGAPAVPPSPTTTPAAPPSPTTARAMPLAAAPPRRAAHSAPPPVAAARKLDGRPSLQAGWLNQADRARRSGQPARARELLERIVRFAADSSEAGIAAFTLARMQLVHDPRAAASALVTALAGDIPTGLREDAQAMLVEAHARAGQVALARAAAAEYARSFPNGRRATEVKRWAADP